MSVLQTCSRVLLTDEVKYSLLDSVRKPGLSYLHKKALNKKINEKTKKMTKCVNCGAKNGNFRTVFSLESTLIEYFHMNFFIV